MTQQNNQRVPNGKIALVSGGSRGIGAAIARALWVKGYRVAILYQKNQAAAEAVLATLGEDCLALQCDVADFTQCETAFAQIVRQMGEVDVLVCNAGIAQQKMFGDISLFDWSRMMAVHLDGAFYLSKLALPAMIREKQGRIINISSMWGQVGASCEVHYSAAKAGLIGFTKALAKEEGPSGITVNCVCPGVIDTDMMAGFSQEDKAALAEETPISRLGTPQEVANLVCFLASEEASYITGQVLGINGGLVV